MAKRATKATKQEKHIIKVGYCYLDKNNELTENKAAARTFDSHPAAFNFAAELYQDKNEHKYKIVPA